MKRRALLASLGATGAVTGAAGCLQAPGESGETTPDDGTATTTEGDTATTTADGAEPTTENEQEPTTENEQEPTSDGAGEWNPSGEPVATLSINDREGLSFPDNNRPHSLALWNAVDREREVGVTWVDGRTEELERLDPVAVPADGLLQVDLLLPTSYDVIVRVDGDPLRHQPPVPFFSARGFRPGPTGPFNAAADPTWTVGERASVRLASTNHPRIVAGARVTVELRYDGRRLTTLTATG